MAQLERLHGGPFLEAAFDFRGGGTFEPEFDGFGEHGVGCLASFALAGDAQLGTTGNKPPLVLFHDRRQARQRDDFAIFVDPAWLHERIIAKTARVGNSKARCLESFALAQGRFFSRFCHEHAS